MARSQGASPVRPVQWGAESIWQAVMELAHERGDTRLAGFSVEVLPSTGSTNTELMRRARAGQTEPTLLVAEQQTAGRGRLGRVWESGQDPVVGDSLTFSLGLQLAPMAWDGLSLAVGVSVAENVLGQQVSSPQTPIQLKWPNDLWWQDRKLAGILIETVAAGAIGARAAPTAHAGSQRYVVIGVGINIAPRPALGLSTPPTWLQALQADASAPQALARVAAALLRDVLVFEAQGFAPFAPRFAACDALYGRTVGLSDGRQGLAQGVDAQGALLVHTVQGMERIASAEVSVRPVADGKAAH